MPCDAVRVMTSDYKNCDVSVLKAALLRLGMTLYGEDAERGYLYFRAKNGRSGSFGDGRFQLQEGIDVNEIKRAYSREAIEQSSKKYGFSFKQVKGNENQYEVTRRGAF